MVLNTTSELADQYTTTGQNWSVAPPYPLLANFSEIMVRGCLRGSELPESCIELFPAALYAQNRSPGPFWSHAIDSKHLGKGGGRRSNLAL